MLELGIAGGRAVPLQKRTVGNTNISDVFDGQSHIWPTRDDVAYFYDFNSIQLRFIWTKADGSDFDTGTNITNAPGVTNTIIGYGYGPSEGSTQPYLYWGGDNTASGAECVMVDIKSIQDFYTNSSNLTIPEQLVIQLRGNWYGSRLSGIVTVECTAYKGGTIVKAYQLNGSSVGIHTQDYVFADKDGWVFEEGMIEKIWVGEAVKYNDRWYKVNPVDDSVEGMPNLIIQRGFTYQSTSNTSINGYVTFNNKQYKVWNQQVNIDGTIFVQSSYKCINTANTTEAIELQVVALKANGSVYSESISTEFRFGYVAGNSEKRGQQFVRSYVNSEGGNGKKAEEEFAVVNYFDKTESGQVVALKPIT